MKQPWLAANLSMLLPGLGQFYGRQLGKGLLFITGFILLLSRSIWSIFADQGNTLMGFWQLALAMLLYVSSIWDAQHHLANPLSGMSHQPQQISKNSPKNAWYSVFLSQLLPGLGHLYLERPLIGGLFLLGGVGLAYSANNRSPALLPLAYSIWAIAGYHSYRIAPKPYRHNSQQPTPAHNSSRMAAVLVTGVMLTRLVIGYSPTWINQTVLQCIVPSESMLPTLQVNDRIFVKHNRFYRPNTGDIVVFSPPPDAIATLEADPNSLFVKRIIGLPGQQIQIDQGQVWINQQPIQEPYVQQAVNYQWGPETVPPGAYFVLGDNRNYSGDSHLWGFLPKADILGKAYKIYWPSDRIQSLISTLTPDHDSSRFVQRQIGQG